LSNPEAGDARVLVRRRRPTRRHRRNRAIRRVLLASACVLLTGLFSLAALEYLSPSLFRTAGDVEPSRQSAEASRQRFIATQQAALLEMENRKVYPYSIVPGGVKDAHELKWAADHDPVVAAHYAGFDYDHARVVRLALARTAYVSYRMGHRVFWTRRPIRLIKGETLITDGKITARTRCGNRVEDVPQQATSESEPPAEKFDEPVQPAAGTAVSTPPVPFESSLQNRTAPPGLGPAPPLSLYDPLSNASLVAVFPPPIPEVCGVGPTKKPGTGVTTITVTTGKGKKKVVNPCGGGGGVTTAPEPGTWLLSLSGLALVYWKARHKFARTLS
jgi:hypothetical protein